MKIYVLPIEEVKMMGEKICVLPIEEVKYEEESKEVPEETWSETCETCGVLMGGKVFHDEDEFDEYPDREAGYNDEEEWRCAKHREGGDEEEFPETGRCGRCCEDNNKGGSALWNDLCKECDKAEWRGEEEKQWWKVSVDLDGKEYGNFLVFAEDEDEARNTVADNEPQDYEGNYNQMNLVAWEYEGKTSHLDTTMYHVLVDEEETESDDGVEDCECGYTHHYEDKCPSGKQCEKYSKWRDEEDDE